MAKALGHNEYRHYKDAIAELPLKESLEPKDLLRPRFLIEHSDNLEIYYAPVDYVNRRAQIVLVGITPGWHQMEIAYRVAREAILKGLGRITVCKRTKRAAAFSGTMRKNIVEMLDGIGTQKALGIQSSGELFEGAYRKVHSTSVLKYPVFVDRKNYTGHRPTILGHHILKRYVEEVFSVEIGLISGGFIIPLGQAVSTVLQYLVQHGVLSENRCCLGFPHPSGINAHRKGQFQTQRRAMAKKLHRWFDI